MEVGAHGGQWLINVFAVSISLWSKLSRWSALKEKLFVKCQRKINAGESTGRRKKDCVLIPSSHAAAGLLAMHIAPTQYPTNQLPSRKKMRCLFFFFSPIRREFQNKTFFFVNWGNV